MNANTAFANTVSKSAHTDMALAAENIDVHFAGLHALKDVTLTLAKGQVVGLIGPNGAGKTTLVNVLTGFQAPQSGRLYLGDRNMAKQAAYAFTRAGVARTFQGARLFASLSVRDNLSVTGIGLGYSRKAAQGLADDVIEQLGLQKIAHTHCSVLAYIDERRVAVARAVVGAPHHLLLDEPAAGMNHFEAAELQALIAQLVQTVGCGVLLIEHNLRLVLDTCSHIVVLDAGAVIERGSPTQIQNSERVRHAYMGTELDAASQPGALL